MKNEAQSDFVCLLSGLVEVCTHVSSSSWEEEEAERGRESLKVVLFWHPDITSPNKQPILLLEDTSFDKETAYLGRLGTCKSNLI